MRFYSNTNSFSYLKFFIPVDISAPKGNHFKSKFQYVVKQVERNILIFCSMIDDQILRKCTMIPHLLHYAIRFWNRWKLEKKMKREGRGKYIYIYIYVGNPSLITRRP